MLMLLVLASAFLFISCDSIARDNPNDPGSNNYRGYQLLSSEAVVVSSSSAVVAVLSSSSLKPSSSSGVLQSSSSIAVAPSSSSGVIAVSSSSSKPSSSSITDYSSSSSVNIVGNCPNAVIGNNTISCGGQSYKTVKIGEQVWMAENLNYAVEGSKCHNNIDANGAIYGRLYDWATAMVLPDSCVYRSCASQVGTKHKGICPSGWHIPSYDEWTTLTDFVGTKVGTKLKATKGWNSGDKGEVGDGTDDFGFSALPGGLGDYGGGFYDVGIKGVWLSADDFAPEYAPSLFLSNAREDAICEFNHKSNLCSVRCLQD